jgi:hypothetical protein
VGIFRIWFDDLEVLDQTGATISVQDFAEAGAGGGIGSTPEITALRGTGSQTSMTMEILSP